MNRGLLQEKEENAWIFLNQVPDLGPLRFHRLLHTAQSARGILEMSVAALQSAEVDVAVAERWYRFFHSSDAPRSLEAELHRVARGHCRIVTELDASYPERLREVVGRPPVLYYKGRWPLPHQKVIGLVGTRHPSAYGWQVAQDLTRDLARRGYATVSGLAEGIDTCAHQTTLRETGYTIAILGCGLGQVFPWRNANLQRQIEQNGTVISEFPYETPPESRNFPRRNRVISGLAEKVVVIEAGSRSGATITARYAAEQGRDVYAVPGSIYEPMSAGCHRLIQEGAKLVTQVSDILEEADIQDVTPAEAVPNGGQSRPLLPKVRDGVQSGGPLDSGFRRNDGRVFDTLSALEKQIWEMLEGKTLTADDIAQRVAQRFEHVAKTLLSLELKGIVRALPGQRYGQN